MAGVIFELDPVSEDAANVPLVLVDNSTYFLTGMDFPEPEVDQSTVSSVTTEGELPVSARHHNTTGTINLRVVGSTAAGLQTALNYIDKKLAKIMREGGTLKCTTPAGSTYVSDLLSGALAVQFTRRYVTSSKADVTITLARRPYWRGAPVTLSSHSETTLPVLIFTEASITGDVPALGRLIVTEGQAVDQFWLTFGVQSRYYSSSADAALFYQAEGRTALGGSATNTGPTGASGTSVMRSAGLTTSYVAILSTQATGGGNHLAHIGDYQVYARFQAPTTNTGAVSVALEWAQGDFLRVTRNAAVTFPIDSWDGTWRLMNLGQVSLTKVVQGTQRWEGRIVATSTHAGDTIDVDYLMLVPITEGSGTVAGRPPSTTPTSFNAQDGFDQSAGALVGKTAPIGGAWAAGIGAGTDFAVETTGHTAQRATTGDAGGQGVISGATAFASVVQRIDFKATRYDLSAGADMGMFARWVDSSNYAYTYVESFTATKLNLKFDTRVGGVNQGATITNIPLLLANAWYTLTVTIDAAGKACVYLSVQGSGLGDPLIVSQRTELATGGALATGKPGLFDYNPTAIAVTRNYDNFMAYAFTSDAALFASRQLEIRNDRVIRQDSAGVVWASPSSFEGDYLLIQPSGREGRTTRIAVKGCRNDPATGADSAIDDISAQLVVTPRFLTLPE